MTLEKMLEELVDAGLSVEIERTEEDDYGYADYIAFFRKEGYMSESGEGRSVGEAVEELYEEVKKSGWID